MTDIRYYGRHLTGSASIIWSKLYAWVRRMFLWWRSCDHRHLAAPTLLLAAALTIQVQLAQIAESNLKQHPVRTAQHTAGQDIATPHTAPASRGGAAFATVDGSVSREDVVLMARVIEGEAAGESYRGKVAVGAVILNRTQDRHFPSSIKGVVYQKNAFEAVSNGQIWRRLTPESLRAAEDALKGQDPTQGAIYYWNPNKRVNPWVWSRPVHMQIGNHVFAH